jgi:hypothetical protein
MNDEQLRARIAAHDPLRGAPIDPATSASARALLEDIMSTDSDTLARTDDITHRAPARRWRKPASAAAALIAIVAVGIVAMTGNDGDSDVAAPPTSTVASAPTTPAPGKLKVIELSAPTENTMAMCMEITPALLADMQVAFRGTVDTVDGEVVTLRIDQAYVGTDAQMATLVAPPGMQALIGGVDFVVGQEYLITATDGVVNYCGASGPATPELQALFDAAFAA